MGWIWILAGEMLEVILRGRRVGVNHRKAARQWRRHGRRFWQEWRVERRRPFTEGEESSIILEMQRSESREKRWHII